MWNFIDIIDEIYGAQLKPDVTLTYDGKTLVEGTDYSVAYGENIVPGTNNGKVTFTGMGDYAGTVYKSFNILAKSFSDAVDKADCE